MTGCVALVVAAGRGHRMGGAVPKQYMPLAGRPLLAHTMSTLTKHPGIDAVLATIHPDDRGLYEEAAAGLTYSYESDATLARLMSERAERTVVLATARKLAQRDRIVAMSTACVNVLVTDCTDAATLAPFADAGIEVLIAQAEEAEGGVVAEGV